MLIAIARARRRDRPGTRTKAPPGEFSPVSPAIPPANFHFAINRLFTRERSREETGVTFSYEVHRVQVKALAEASGAEWILK